MTEDEAFEAFTDWYSGCIESGFSPEDIVEREIDMKLLITAEQIEAYEIGLEEMEKED
jgi:hypothetical protein